METLLSVFSPFTVITFSICLWLAVMILVPVIRRHAGAGGERIGITLGVLVQVMAVVLVLVSSLGWWSLVVIVLVPLLGWTSEVIGSRTGFPFGRYHYTDVLQPQVAHVPVLIPLAWLMMVPPSWAVAATIAPGRPLLQWVIAAAAFTAWDLYLDPQMVWWDFWRWDRPGCYLGIPAVNFAGWFMVSFLISAAIGLIGTATGVRFTDTVGTEPLLVIFTLTWLLQFVGQFFFWKLRVSAVVGFLAMGAFVLAMFLGIG